MPVSQSCNIEKKELIHASKLFWDRRISLHEGKHLFMTRSQRIRVLTLNTRPQPRDPRVQTSSNSSTSTPSTLGMPFERQRRGAAATADVTTTVVAVALWRRCTSMRQPRADVESRTQHR